MKFIHIPADPSEPMKLVEVGSTSPAAGYEKARELIGGGYVQTTQVQGYKRLQLCVDEDGFAKQLPTNVRAMMVAALGQNLVGDAVVTALNFRDVESVAPELIATINAWEGVEL